MYIITRADVRNVIAELTGGCPSGESYLYPLLRKTVYRSVCAQCRTASCLRGKGLEEDILHDVWIRVWNHAYRVLFAESGVNDDPKAFAAWLATVTNNRVRDYIRRVSREEARLAIEREDGERDEEESAIERVAAPVADRDAQDGAEELLERVVGYVMEHVTSAHVNLAWLAFTAAVVADGEERSRAAKNVVNRYADTKLNEMFRDVLKRAAAVPWLRDAVAPGGKLRSGIGEKMAKQGSGDKEFSAFFMSKGGEASVSDWVNRVNSRIRKEMQKL